MRERVVLDGAADFAQFLEHAGHRLGAALQEGTLGGAERLLQAGIGQGAGGVLLEGGRGDGDHGRAPVCPVCSALRLAGRGRWLPLRVDQPLGLLGGFRADLGHPAQLLARLGQILLGLVLQRDEPVVGAMGRPDELVEFHVDGLGVAVLGVLDRKTIRKVMIVVPVLITSCQVSEKPNTGPVTAQTSTTATAVTKAQDRPAWVEAHCAARAKGDGSAMRTRTPHGGGSFRACGLNRRNHSAAAAKKRSFSPFWFS